MVIIPRHLMIGSLLCRLVRYDRETVRQVLYHPLTEVRVPKGSRPYTAIFHQIKNRRFLANIQYVARSYLVFVGLQLKY